MSPVTRRQLLGGALVASGAALGSAAVGWAPSGSDPSSSHSYFRLSAVDLSLTSPTFRKGSHLQPGERLLARGRLVDPGGAPLGSFVAIYTVVERRDPTGAPAATSAEQHTFDFPDGTIIGTGLGTLDPDIPDRFAIVGGTGRYTAARGSYTAVQRHLELGGDGTAEFLIGLTP